MFFAISDRETRWKCRGRRGDVPFTDTRGPRSIFVGSLLALVP
jgi:hypothetical protein